MMQQGGPQPVQPSAGGQHGQKLELFHQANVKGNAMIAMHTCVLFKQIDEKLLCSRDSTLLEFMDIC